MENPARARSAPSALVILAGVAGALAMGLGCDEPSDSDPRVGLDSGAPGGSVGRGGDSDADGPGPDSLDAAGSAGDARRPDPEDAGAAPDARGSAAGRDLGLVVPDALAPVPPPDAGVDPTVCGPIEPIADACHGLPADVDEGALRGLDVDALDAPRPDETPCDPEEVEAFFEDDADRLRLGCSLTFPAGAVLRRNLILEGDRASDLTVDCNGGAIDPADPDRFTLRIRSLEEEGEWRRPARIRIVDCEIRGAVRIQGLGRNGEAEGVRLSSVEAGHTERAQGIAPTDIVFNRVHIIGTGPIPFYLGPGTTHVALLNSRLSGESASTTIYLDAESAHNVIQNNVLETTTAIEREVIAVDGSAHNLIAGNTIASLVRGGIYVYRNCGEGGTVRHQKPRFNRIVNNDFRYAGEADFFNPAIWLGSRAGLRLYCGADDGYDFGSSADNADFADHNLVVGNQIRGHSPEDKILDDGAGNRVEDNVQVEVGALGRSPCAFFDTCAFHLRADGDCLRRSDDDFRCEDGHFRPE